MELMDAENYK